MEFGFVNFNKGGMVQLLHKELSFKINGILFTVHNTVGKYASEKQVCDLLEEAFKKEGVVYQREYFISSQHDEEKEHRHRVDFIIENKIVLEIKYRKFLQKEDYFQVKRYLHALNLALGILVNFREERLHPKRILNGGGKV